MKHHHEIHLCLRDVGHIFDPRCWCEPSPIYWYVDQSGKRVQIIEHNDETAIPHAIILVQRQATVNMTEDSSSDSPWVTRVLDNPTEPPSLNGIMVPPKPKKEPPNAS